ncbi:unnamed protein product [Urochloa humidicola]
MSSEFNESAIVGEMIEKDTKELAHVLINDDKLNMKVVSVVGVGGIGKTTLAQKIFKEKTIQEQFNVKIWLSITQYFDEVDLLRTAIEHAGVDPGGMQDKSLLMRTLTDILSKGKFFLVMDDVWSEKAWNNVLSVPILNASYKRTGNRVLVTTRLEDLAQRMQASFHQHHVSPLHEEDAWSLLKKQLPLQSNNQVVEIDHLKDVGMKIIKKCGGLPLAIKVMGGLLSTRSRSEFEWEAVLKHHAWSIAGLPKELDNRLYLSYEDLSPQLKQCFLYCSLFPKGTYIRKRDIIPMWISEGFIQPRHGSSSREDQLEDIANEYYRDLIMRNLIEPTEGSTVNGYHCTMHDVVRSFAEFIAREETLVVQDEHAPGVEGQIQGGYSYSSPTYISIRVPPRRMNEEEGRRRGKKGKEGRKEEEETPFHPGSATAGGSSHSLLRRLSIGSTKSVPEWGILEMQKSVRTLIISHKIDIKPNDSLGSLSSLRVLLIRDNADCDRLVDSLGQWKHLRYLHLENTDISRLPQEIYRIKFLQHIVLRGSRNLETLPRSIIQLVHLRTLDLDNLNVNNILIPKGFSKLTDLRSLFGFPVHMGMDKDEPWCSLEEIGPLSQLRYLTVYGLHNVSRSSLAEKARISSKKHLIYLELNWNNRIISQQNGEIEKQQQQAAEEVIEKLCPPPCIQDVRIEGYFGCMLPNWTMLEATAAFKSLRCLGLQDLPCCTKLPDGLCRLPSLEDMYIIDAPAIKSIEFEFQASSSFKVGGGVSTATSVAFPNLIKFALSDLRQWEEWHWEEHAVDATERTMGMPALKELTIRNCKLSVLPPGLANSTREALRELNLYEMRNLTYVENFPSVVVLDVFNCPKLTRINGLSRLQKIEIFLCPNVVVLEGVPSLDSMELNDRTMQTLPRYLRDVNPRYLKLKCSKMLYQSIISGSSYECDKISHISKYSIEYY